MTILLSLEFWLGVQLFIDLVLLGLFCVLFRRLKLGQGHGLSPGQTMEEKIGAEKEAGLAATRIIDMLEPLVKEADKAATSFDEQIRDKKNLMQGLNDSLDSRIISINLLLSRAESMLDRASNAPKVQLPPVTDDRRIVSVNDYPDEDVFDEQKSIVDLYEKGLTADEIASRLSMPKGEVALVISLKKKFVAMENP